MNGLSDWNARNCIWLTGTAVSAMSCAGVSKSPISSGPFSQYLQTGNSRGVILRTVCCTTDHFERAVGSDLTGRSVGRALNATE